MLATMCPDIVFARLPVILTCGIVTALLGFILIKIEFHSHPLSVGSHAKKGIGYPMRVLISIVPSYTTLVRGQGQIEQGLKASVDPGEPEMHEVVETVLTPPHSDPFE